MQLEKAFVNHMSNNGLTLECKQLIQLNNKKKQIIQSENGQKTQTDTSLKKTVSAIV